MTPPRRGGRGGGGARSPTNHWYPFIPLGGKGVYESHVSFPLEETYWTAGPANNIYLLVHL